MSKSFAEPWLVVGSLLVAACNPAFGLDPTISDRDLDGIADARDNCPDEYNPDQADRDGDTIGDACGPCPIQSGRDLDLDGRDDTCDSCIGPGPTGADVDGDGIDDGCDPCIDGVGYLGTDADHDGIPDGCDDCVAAGVDRDLDGVDDACDSCLLGPPHDEDGDGIADACDDCPADADADQAEYAGERVGVACDRDAGTNDVRRLFDSFATLRPEVWRGDAGWNPVGDAMQVGVGADAHALSFFVVRDEFLVRTRVRFASLANPAARLGLWFPSTSGGPVTTYSECALTADGMVHSSQATSSVAIDASSPVELRATRTASGVKTFTCEAIDAHGAHAAASSPSPVGRTFEIDLEASSAVGSFDWIDAIDHPL
jgi:hypothetical protein